MKKKKILLTFALAAMMGLAACGETPVPGPEPEPPVIVVDPVVTGITLKAAGDKTSLEVGETLQLTATVTGEGEFNKSVTYSVDKSDVAEISSAGLLTAKAKGTVRVTATSMGDASKKASLDITVTKPEVTGITLKAAGDATSMEIGTTLQITATVTGTGTFNDGYTLSVDNDTIAEISGAGVLTAKAEGTVVVTATATGDTSQKATLSIAVNEVAAREIKDVVKDVRNHVVGKVTALTTRGLVIDDGTGAVLVYLNAAPSDYAIGDVVSVGGVPEIYHNNVQFPRTSALKKVETAVDTTTIASPTAVTATSYDAMAETIAVLTPISFSATAYSLESGDKTYTAFKVDDSSTHIIEPADLPSSFSVAIGTLYNVTGYVAPYYTSSSSGSSYASFYLTSIAPKPIPVTSITVTAAGGVSSVGLNETVQMGVTVAPEKATNKAVTWSVDKKNIATINDNGVLTGVAAGTVVVTATAKDGSGITGTKSIEVLQFKDPVVSLTLGSAPAETVLGDGDIDVTVSVAGESATSNFNPGYTFTSSDKNVATVEANDAGTGITITPVAAGTVTITVTTSGTNADGEQITKTISLEILGEPRVKTMTLAEAAAWRPEDTTAASTDRSRLVEVTGVFNADGGTNFLVDAEGNAIQLNASYSAGTHTYNSSTKQYSFTYDSKDPARTSTDAGKNALLGRQVTVKGFLDWPILSGRTAVRMVDSVYSDVGTELVAPSFTKKVVGGGSFNLDADENTAYGASVTLTDITPEDGYVLAGVQVDCGVTILNVRPDGSSAYKFNAKTINGVTAHFVKASELSTTTVAQAVALMNNPGMECVLARTPYSDFVKITGKFASFESGPKNFVIADSEDATKKITIPTNSVLSAALNAGELGFDYSVTVIGQVQNDKGTLKMANVIDTTISAGTIQGYTITETQVEHGHIGSIKIGETPVTGPVAPGTVLTVTLSPDEHFKSAGLSANNCAVVTKDPDDNNKYTVTVYGDTELTPAFEADNNLVATMAYPKSHGTGNLGNADNASLIVGGDYDGQSAATVLGLTSTIFTVTGAKNGGSLYPGVNKSGFIALYPKSGNGTSFTVSLVDSTAYTIVRVIITLTNDSAGTLTVYNAANAAVTPTGSTYEIGGSSFKCQNTFDATSGNQLKISSITITYAPVVVS